MLIWGRCAAENASSLGSRRDSFRLPCNYYAVRKQMGDERSNTIGPEIQRLCRSNRRVDPPNNKAAEMREAGTKRPGFFRARCPRG